MMKYLYKNHFWKPNKEYDIDKLLYLMIDRPSRITVSDDFIWYNNKNRRHRDYDFPSIIDFFIDKTCNLFWYVNCKRHRKNDKPAVIMSDGCKRYYK